MAKKRGPRKKKTAKKGRKAAVRARKLRKPTEAEFNRLSMFKDRSFVSIFIPEVGCDPSLKRKWSAYLRRKG